ncbi:MULTISPECIES: response regulator [Cupriavidus]|uniref:Two-component system, chemotaxis family, response regulator CheY n=1 Tax=Cupriavidus taiwanensis TaxID=164546 RepID=A0A375FBD7_9BURK|nr:MULTISPECIES: response regulator [Cupriavidus]MBB2919211.1 two-component system chemotaxis response regulator CheY [Cupriavidus alkaliphilus]MBB3016235.1 two-component system chemotaxis response regulator CheY [Cupriavidus alkaliphilus]MCO4891356.1 response regulator [Cupriavidus sp. WGtm5]MEC3767523.1 response regulator [Cupriavidus sp. SS-3]PVY69400.1 two-component system chemotaxis response regulator CheY [Cupriavidus alkaliphilus]
MSLPSILVVDDSPSLRRMIGACLRAGGFDVTEAADGDQAHALAVAGSFGMLVTDQVMPGMDGLTLIRSLRATPRYARMPILMLTTEQDGSIREQARAAGASGFLPKPFDPDGLMQAVAALLDAAPPTSEG